MRSELLFSAYFESQRDLLRWATSAVNLLPEALRPTRYGQGELAKSAHDLGDHQAFLDHLRIHGGGCWLYGRGVKFNLSPYTNMPSELDVWTSLSNESVWRRFDDLVRSWDGAGALYGFGAVFEELRAHNGYEIKLIPRGRSEGWFGRRADRYVPGIYWLNYLADDYVTAHALDVSALHARLGGHCYRMRNGVVLFPFERPDQWRENAQRIATVIAETPGMFSKSVIEIPAALTPKEDLAWSAEIQRRWP